MSAPITSMDDDKNQHSEFGTFAPRRAGCDCSIDGMRFCDWDVLPDELRAAGLIVPEPSVAPSPFDWAEYMASKGAMQ